MGNPTHREPRGESPRFRLVAVTPETKAAVGQQIRDWGDKAREYHAVKEPEFQELKDERSTIGVRYLDPEHRELREKYKKLNTVTQHLAAAAELCPHIGATVMHSTNEKLKNFTLLYAGDTLHGVLVYEDGWVQELATNPDNLVPPAGHTPVTGVAAQLLTAAIKQHEREGGWPQPIKLTPMSRKVLNIYDRYFFDAIDGSGPVPRPPSQKDAEGHSVKTPYHHAIYMELSQANAERFLANERRPAPKPETPSSTPGWPKQPPPQPPAASIRL